MDTCSLKIDFIWITAHLCMRCVMGGWHQRTPQDTHGKKDLADCTGSVFPTSLPGCSLPAHRRARCWRPTSGPAAGLGWAVQIPIFSFLGTYKRHRKDFTTLGTSDWNLLAVPTAATRTSALATFPQVAVGRFTTSIVSEVLKPFPWPGSGRVRKGLFSVQNSGASAALPQEASATQVDPITLKLCRLGSLRRTFQDTFGTTPGGSH